METIYSFQNIPLVLMSLAIVYFSERIIKAIRNENKREEKDIKAQDFILDLALKLQGKVDALDKMLREESSKVRLLEQNVLTLINEKERIEHLLEEEKEKNTLKDAEIARLEKINNDLNKQIESLTLKIKEKKEKENE